MTETIDSQPSQDASAATPPRIALALGGGAARGLAHIGVLEVLEREAITPDFIAGSSMGGLIGALSASGLRAREIAEVARGFGFPRWFVPGGLLKWDVLFGSALPVLPRSFEKLTSPLAVTAVDLEAGTEVVLFSGPLVPAVQATCAVPGILPPVKMGGRWLVDGGLVNILPVDVAWMAEPEVVIAVKVGAPRSRRMPQLNWRITSMLAVLGRILPNPATAKASFEVLVRAAEIALDRQSALAAAMTAPEVLIEPALGGMTVRDFGLLDDAVAAGRRAAEAAMPELRRLLECPPRARRRGEHRVSLHFDPVCAMVVSPSRARAKVTREEAVYYFCSVNCRDIFLRDGERSLAEAGLAFGARRNVLRTAGPAQLKEPTPPRSHRDKAAERRDGE